jgi:predicted nucleotidyltransferase
MDQALLDDIVRRIVEVAHPERIILFGSAARGDMGPDSDVDLLVVKSGVASRGRLEEEIHLSFFGLGASVDVVVATLEDIDIFRDRPGTVIQPALEEGIEVYAA